MKLSLIAVSLQKRVPLVWSFVRLIAYTHHSLHIVPLMAPHTTKGTVHLATDLNAIYSLTSIVASIFSQYFEIGGSMVLGQKVKGILELGVLEEVPINSVYLFVFIE